MKVGSLVELVKDDFTYSNGAKYFPVRGKIYTIREIVPICSISTHISCLLEEIINPKVNYGGIMDEPCFRLYRFRELLPPISNIEEHINENTLETVLT